MYFSGIRNVSSSVHGVELEVDCDDDEESHLESTRSRHGFHRHLFILSIEALPVRLVVLHWDLLSLRLVPAYERVRGIRSLSLTILLFHLLPGIWIQSPFVKSIHLSRWFFEDWFLMLPNSPTLPIPQSEYLLSKFHTAINWHPRKITCNTFLKNWCILINLSATLHDVKSLLHKEFLALAMILHIVFRTEFSLLPRSLGHFADSNTIPKNQPTMFHRIL